MQALFKGDALTGSPAVAARACAICGNASHHECVAHEETYGRPPVHGHERQVVGAANFIGPDDPFLDDRGLLRLGVQPSQQFDGQCA
jgi:hypothetical protein